jgi:hypothetical protein
MFQIENLKVSPRAKPVFLAVWAASWAQAKDSPSVVSGCGGSFSLHSHNPTAISLLGTGKNAEGERNERWGQER